MIFQARKIVGATFTSLTGIAAAIIVSMIALVLFDIVRGGYAQLSWIFLTSAPEQGMTAGGIFPALVGTAELTLIMTLVVSPIGIVTAIYLSEYATPNSHMASWVRLAINNLAGVPSIVFGLFGLGFFVQFLGGAMDQSFNQGEVKYGQPGLLWAALTLAVLTLPVVIVATEEALRAVPIDLRIASLALGATKSQTLIRVVLPSALPGIFTAMILAVSRGAGEVAPILLTGAAYYLPNLPDSPFSQFMHLGYHTYVLATQSPDVEAARPLFYGTALVLVLLTFTLNAVAIAIRIRARRSLGVGT